MNLVFCDTETTGLDELCAQACAGNVIRMRPDLPPHAAWYPVSHEIAEDRTDFRGHTQLLWRTQLDILARWCSRLSDRVAELERELEEANRP